MATTKEVTGPVNLGNPNEFTMLELAEKVVKWTGNDTPLQFEKLPQDDPKQRRPVIAEAQRILDWEPKVMLDEGLQKTIAYFASKVQER